jgi:hypothetical protein
MTHTSGGQRLAGVARRNVGKSPGGMARLLEFTNAHMPGEGSSPRTPTRRGRRRSAGKTRRQDILYDSREAPPHLSLHDEEQLMAGLRAAYADSPWADLERLRDEAQDPRVPIADAIRYYFSSLPTSEDAWIDPRKFDARRPSSRRSSTARRSRCSSTARSPRTPPRCAAAGSATGTSSRSAAGSARTAIAARAGSRRATRSTPRSAPRSRAGTCSGSASTPRPPATTRTRRCTGPTSSTSWHRDFRDKVLVWATPARRAPPSRSTCASRARRPDRVRQITEEAELTAAAIDVDGPLTWDGDPMLRLHVHNARRRPNQWGVSIGKQSRGSSKLVDYAVSMVGARLGRRLVLNSGKRARKRSGKAVFV